MCSEQILIHMEKCLFRNPAGDVFGVRGVYWDWDACYSVG